MDVYCNEHRLYSRLMDEEGTALSWEQACSYPDHHALVSGLAEEDAAVPRAAPSLPLTQTTRTMCGEHRSVFRFADEATVQARPVAAALPPCQSHRMYSLWGEDWFSSRHGSLSHQPKPGYVCGEGRALHQLVDQDDLPPPAAKVARHTEHQSSPVSGIHSPSFCTEHRSHRIVEGGWVPSTAPSWPRAAPLAMCCEHRATHVSERNAVPEGRQPTADEGEPASLSMAGSASLATTVVASSVADCCYGPFGASAGQEEFLRAVGGQEVPLGAVPCSSLEDTFVWYAVVAKASGNLVHARFLQHIAQHACVVGTQVFGRVGDHVKGLDAGVPDLLAVVRMTAETLAEAQESAAVLLSTVAVPLTASKAPDGIEKPVRSTGELGCLRA